MKRCIRTALIATLLCGSAWAAPAWAEKALKDDGQVVEVPSKAEGPTQPKPPTADEQLAQCRAVLRAVARQNLKVADQLLDLAGPEGK